MVFSFTPPPKLAKLSTLLSGTPWPPLSDGLLSGTIAMSLPRIDLTCWSDPTGTFEARAAAATALDKACASVGFFYIHMPGLAEASDRLLQRCREFHGLRYC